MIDILEIKGFSGYGVSCDGRVWSRRNRWGMTDWREMRPTLHPKGYLRVCMYRDGIKEYQFVHRLVAYVFFGEIQHDMQINHINGVKSDNRTDNLETCTASENIKHSRNILGIGVGVKHGMAKLKESDIAGIRIKAESARVCADRYGVSVSTIKAIRAGRIWRSVAA